jgi:hypothetical protein
MAVAAVSCAPESTISVGGMPGKHGSWEMCSLRNGKPAAVAESLRKERMQECALPCSEEATRVYAQKNADLL